MQRQSFNQQMGFESPLGKESAFYVEHDDPIDSQYNEAYTFQIVYCSSGIDVFDKYNANKDLKSPKSIVIYYEKPDKNKSNLFGTACRVRMGSERRELMLKLKSNKVSVSVKGFPAAARNISEWAKEITKHSGNVIDAKILENAVKFEFFSKTEMNSFFQKLFGINNKLADWLADGVGEMEKWKFTEENYEFALYGEKLKPLLPLSAFKPSGNHSYSDNKNEKKLAASGLTQLVKLYDSLDTIVFAKAFALASITPGIGDDVIIGFVWLVKEFLDRKLSPQIKELFAKVKSIVKSASDFIAELKKEIIEEIAIINAFLCGLINGLISILQTILGLVAFVVDNIPILELEKVSPQTVNSFQEKLEFIEDLIDIVSDNFYKIYEGIKKTIKNLGTDLKKLITAIGNKLQHLSKYFWAYFIGAVVFELILDAIIAFFTGGTALAAKLAANITRLSKQVAKKGIQLAEKTAAKAAASTASVINSVKAFFIEFIEALKSGKFIEWVQEKLLRALPKQLDDVISLLPENKLSPYETRLRINKINETLKSSTAAFNPDKPALKKLGVTLYKSKNGLSVDFAKTPQYLYEGKVSNKSIVKIKLKGSRDLDFDAAWKKAGFTDEQIKAIDKRYMWHHLDDFDPNTGEATLQLVEAFIHGKSRPHIGSVRQVEMFYEITYK